MTGSGGEFAVAYPAQLAAHRLFGDADTELLGNPLAKIDDPPTHDATDRRSWAVLDHARESGAMYVLEPRRLVGRLAVDQPLRAMSVEAQHPTAKALEADPADRRCLALNRAVVDRRQSQKPARLRPVLRALRNRTQSVASKSPRSPIAAAMANLLGFAMANQISVDSGIPRMSLPQRGSV